PTAAALPPHSSSTLRRDHGLSIFAKSVLAEIDANRGPPACLCALHEKSVAAVTPLIALTFRRGGKAGFHLGSGAPLCQPRIFLFRCGRRGNSEKCEDNHRKHAIHK